jgi:hypothetical protein
VKRIFVALGQAVRKIDRARADRGIAEAGYRRVTFRRPSGNRFAFSEPTDALARTRHNARLPLDLEGMDRAKVTIAQRPGPRRACGIRTPYPRERPAA